MEMTYEQRVTEAAKTYIRRQNRAEHPNGHFDNAKRWEPSTDETCDCCHGLRTPSRRHPFSLMMHCRTAVHIANLAGVCSGDVLKEARRLKKLAACASATA